MPPPPLHIFCPPPPTLAHVLPGLHFLHMSGHLHPPLPPHQLELAGQVSRLRRHALILRPISLDKAVQLLELLP